MALQLNGITLLTHDPAKMRAFYERVLNQKGDGSNTHVVFELNGGTLVLWRAQNLEDMVPNAMQDTGSGSTIVSFQVSNVDAEYDRIKDLSLTWLQHPTTHPWGRRAMWFRDPEGHIVNFFQIL